MSEQSDKITPSDEEVVESIILVHKLNPDMGSSKVASLIRTNHPEWSLSEKRIKKVIQKYELLDSSHTTILLGEDDTPIDRDVYIPFFTGELDDTPAKPSNPNAKLKESVRERLREKIKQFDYKTQPNQQGIQITIEKGKKYKERRKLTGKAGLESIIGENFEPVAINLGDPESLREYMNERMSDLVKSMGFPIIQLR